MTITQDTFFKTLLDLHRQKGNYKFNLENIKGRYKYSDIFTCEINSITYYGTHGLDKAYSNLSTLKRMISRWVI
jgi:hypothetical protein